MIVIALSALAYTWFSGIFASMTASAGTAVTTTTNAMQVQYMLESAPQVGTLIGAYLRNTGTQIIDCTKVACYVNDVLANASCGVTTNLNKGDVCVLVAANQPACTCVNHQCGKSLSVTTVTGLQQTLNVTC